MNSRVHSALISWEPVSAGLAMALFGITLFDVAVLAIYAPIPQAEQALKIPSTSNFRVWSTVPRGATSYLLWGIETPAWD